MLAALWGCATRQIQHVYSDVADMLVLHLQINNWQSIVHTDDSVILQLVVHCCDWFV